MSRNKPSYYGVVVGVLLVMSFFANAYAVPEKHLTNKAFDQWLKDEYAQQHQALIPVVVVADMYLACYNAKKNTPQVVAEKSTLSVDYLMTEISRELLATKLQQCLAGESVQSDTAINYGLISCFKEQLAHLNAQEQQEKMAVVTTAIATLPKSERKKSLTQCATDQAIRYLK